MEAAAERLQSFIELLPDRLIGDELFELLTLIQTGKVAPIPVLLFGREFWEKVVNFEALVEEGVIAERDLDIFTYVESAAEGWAVVQRFYQERAQQDPAPPA